MAEDQLFYTLCLCFCVVWIALEYREYMNKRQ